MGSLFLLVFLSVCSFIKPMPLRCFARCSDIGSRLCKEECRADQVCHFSFHVYNTTVTAVDHIGCRGSPSVEDICSTKCLVEQTHAVGTYACCCDSTDCNIITGLYPDYSPLPPPLPIESTPPPMQGMATCVNYRQQNGNFLIVYEVCRGFCWTEYRRNERVNYELASSKCINSTNSTVFPESCMLNSSGSALTISCACSGFVCNSARNVLFSDDTRVVASEDRVCDGMMCSQICVRHPIGAPTCLCREGFELASNGKDCKDIDECQKKFHNCQSHCINTEGSFMCGCDDMYVLDRNGRTCREMGFSCATNLTCAPNDFKCLNLKECPYRPSNNYACFVSSKKNGVFKPVFTLCFTADNSCGSETCVVKENANIYSCCCTVSRCTERINYSALALPMPTDPVSTVVEASITISSDANNSSSPQMPTRIISLLSFEFAGVVIAVAALSCFCFCYIMKKRSSSNELVEMALQPPADRINPSSVDILNKSKVGEGSYGQVYRTTSTDYAHSIAIKEFSDVEQYNRELDILSKVDFRHPNIILFLGRDTTFQRLWIIMGYEDQGSLHKILSSGNLLTWKNTHNLVVTMLRGLAYLHKCNIAHRDIKSSNILASNWNSKIADFGLALQFPLERDSPGSQVGTPRYMAVEVIQGSMNTFDFQAYSRIDNYAVGLVLWELLSRTQPPPGTDPSSVLNYALPFQEYLTNNSVTVLDMSTLFKENSTSLRPTIMSYFLREPKYDELIKVIQDTWWENPVARITSTCCLARLDGSRSPSPSSSSSSSNVDFEASPNIVPVITTAL